MAIKDLAQVKTSPLFRSMTVLLLAVLFVNLVSPISTVQAAVSPPVFLFKWGSYGTANGQFDTPMGIAVNSSLGRVYVVDSFNNRIQYFDMNGVYGGQAGTYGFDAGEFNWPQGITINQSTGQVYLADTINSKVQVFNADLGSPLAFGSYGTADGQFKRPYDVAVDSAGNYYVADTFNHRIQKFNGNTNDFMMKFGSYGTGNGQFIRPSGVAVDAAGNIYVIDEMHRVQKFDASGTYLSSWGSFGQAEGQFNTPRDIDFDSAGNIYVADTGNQRIQKFTSAGVFVSQWGGYGTANGQFNNPWGVVALGSDEVFVADTDNNRVQRFETNQAPTDISLTPAVVYENRSMGTLVGALAAVDSNLSDTFTFELVAGEGGTDNAAFALTGPTLVTALTFDYETKAAYSIRVQVTDSGGMTYEEALTVTIVNDNDAPTVSGGPLWVDENTPNGTVVGPVVAEDEDSTTGFTYAIMDEGNTDGAFSIDADGQIIVANSAALDFETTQSFILTVQVTDDGSPTGTPKSGTGTVFVNVNPVNDPPTLTGFSASIPENSANGTSVGTMTGSDPDDNTLTYSITEGNTNNAFAINSSTGAITVNNIAALDRETTPSFTLTVTVTDNGTPELSASATATITLTDVNEFTPVMNDEAWNLPENSPVDTVVGTMSATDGDTGSTFTYAITAGNGSGAFAINSTTGAIRVANSSPLDMETTPTFVLTIEVTDSGLPARTDTAAATITLTNVNETPSVPAQTMTVPENSANGTSVGTVSVVDVDSSAWTFTVTGGTGSNYFAVASDTGAVTVTDGTALNFESSIPSYTLIVQATDGGGLSGSGTVTINLTDVNENPSVPAQTLSVPENSGSGTEVGTVLATDPDVGSSFTFIKTGVGTGAALFNVSSTGVVTVADGAILDFEGTSSYTLEVQVTDNGTPGLTGSGTVTINVTNVNEAPVLNDTSRSVDENSANGTTVGDKVIATDVDEGSVLTYSITAIAPDTIPATTPAAFAIGATTGQITVGNSAVLNYEKTKIFTLTVEVSDGSLSDTATVTINLNDVNDVPVVSGGPFTLAENSTATPGEWKATATDEDVPAQTLTWAITGGNDLGAFTINAVTGQITVANATPLDFETNPTFTLTVTATDNGSPNLSGSATVTINLTNVNEAPVVTGVTFSLAENSPVDTVVGTVPATDPEKAALTWSITGGNDLGAFTINTTSGQITVADSAPLDFETHPTFTLTVRAADPGGLWDEAQVTINLTNANELPVVNPVTFSLPENSPAATSVGTGTATDPDHTSFTWSITYGNTGSAFAINASTGEITVLTSAAVNFEATPTFTLTVRAVDGAGAWGEGLVTINLTNVNENPSVPAQTMSVAENSGSGTEVGTVTATDPDAGSTFTFAKVAGGTGTALFEVSVAGLVTVADGAVLNFEGISSYTLEVQATDNGGLTGSGTVTINLTNVNEAPVLNDTSRSVDENSANGTAVGTPVAATDVDAGSVLTYSITAINPATDPAAFAINASTGAITVANSAVINHEANAVFTLTVQVTDNGSPALSDTATVTVSVNDLNDAPVVTGNTFSLAENSPAATVVGTVTATDEDVPAQTLTWSITAGNSLGSFTINPATGQITVANSAPLDLETNPTFLLTVQATDNGAPNLSGSATVTINLTNVNEVPVVSDATFSLAENSPATTVVGTVTANDPEKAALTWSITGGNDLGAFTINTTSGQITVINSVPLDLETHPTFSLIVQAEDPGGLTGSGTVTINLTNANEPPVVFDNAFYLSENSPVTTLVGIVVANDPDHTTFTWTITGGNTGNAFAINNSGHITVANAAPLDYETTTVFTLTVKAADGGGLFDEGTVTVNLLDANDVPVVTDAAFSVLETSANGFVVGSVVATDQDAGQTLTYSITAGNTGDAFAINPATGQITVADNTGFNYATTPPFNLTILVEDNGAPVLSDSGTVTVTIQPAADLELTALVGPTNGISGSTGLYSVQVTNIGPGAAEAYDVEVTLPAPLTMAATGSAPGCTFVAPVITCPAAALASGATAEIVVAVYFPSSVEGAVELLAEIVPGGGDLDATNHNASLTVTVIASTVVVDDDFEDGADDGWSTDQRSTTPEGGRNFLGEFANQRITFEAHDLPAHSKATISFDLFVIRSWDGNNLMDGPDHWLMDLDGVTLVNTTFSNWNDVLRQQAYPGNYPGASYPAQTGAEEVNTLGYRYGSDWLVMDAVYHIEMTVDHSAADLIVALEGMGLSGLAEESWGVDNFKIVLSGQQEYKVYLPLLLR